MEKKQLPKTDLSKDLASQSWTRDPDFSLLDSDDAVAIFRNSRAEYLISIDLSGDGKVGIVNGDIRSRGNKSSYGGPNPEFARMSASEAYERAELSKAGSSCVVNSSFFSVAKESSSPLAFSTKKDNKILSDGFADRSKHKDRRLTLAFSDNYARILPFRNDDYGSFRRIPEKDAIVSLSPLQNIDGRSKERLGRTFLGLSDPIGKDRYSRLLIFVSPASTQDHAAETLRRFGAQPLIMLDGGGSSQLYCNGKYLVKSQRMVPQFLAIGSKPKK